MLFLLLVSLVVFVFCYFFYFLHACEKYIPLVISSNPDLSGVLHYVYYDFYRIAIVLIPFFLFISLCLFITASLANCRKKKKVKDGNGVFCYSCPRRLLTCTRRMLKLTLLVLFLYSFVFFVPFLYAGKTEDVDAFIEVVLLFIGLLTYAMDTFGVLEKAESDIKTLCRVLTAITILIPLAAKLLVILPTEREDEIVIYVYDVIVFLFPEMKGWVGGFSVISMFHLFVGYALPAAIIFYPRKVKLTS